VRLADTSGVSPSLAHLTYLLAMTPSNQPTNAETAQFPIDPRDLIVGLGRGLKVIESFDDDHSRMTLAEVSARTSIPRTATRRHLLSLCHFGYAQTDGKLFWLAPRVLRLGQSYLGSARLPRLVQPFIQRLSMVTGDKAIYFFTTLGQKLFAGLHMPIPHTIARAFKGEFPTRLILFKLGLGRFSRSNIKHDAVTHLR